MSKVQEHGFRSAFLKNYALIKQAHQLSIKNDEDFYGDIDPISALISERYKSNPDLIKQYFKVAKGPFLSIDHNWGVTAIQKLYNDKPLCNLNYFFKQLNGSNDLFWYDTDAFAFQLEDGTIIAFFITYCRGHGIMMDVNGAKGPNTYGKDIYFLEYTSLGNGNNSPIKDTGEIFQIVPSGVIGTQYCGGSLWWSEPENDCTKNGAGTRCAREIIKNKNYKIK